MIIYSESFHVEHSIEDEWILWMKEVIIPEMYQTGKFSKAVFSKVISHPDESGNTYSLQYYVQDKSALNDFYKNHSRRISQLIQAKFGSKVLSFMTELDLLESFDF